MNNTVIQNEVKNVITVSDIIRHSFIISIKEEQLKTADDIFRKTIGMLPEHFPGCTKYGLNSLNSRIRNCTQSHVDIVSEAKKRNYPYVLIFEDDAYPRRDILQTLDEYLRQVPLDADLVKIGFTRINKNQPRDQKFNRIRTRSYGTQSYIVFQSGYDRFLEFFSENSGLAADSEELYGRLNAYQTDIQMFIQYNATKGGIHGFVGYQYLNRRNAPNPPDGFDPIEVTLQKDDIPAPRRKAFFKIVVPNYNNHIYIRKCLNSILLQTFQDYVCVVVDDRSEDDSVNIAQEYAEKYPEKFVVIRLPEKRYAGGCRNAALEYPMDCRYFMFLDSDDWFAVENGLERVHQKIVENDFPDVVRCSHQTFRTLHVESPDPNDFLQHGAAPWKNVVNAKYEHIRFKENRARNNDVVWFLRLIDQVDLDKIVVMNEVPLVFYNTRSLTSCQKYETKKSAACMDAYKFLIKDLEKENFRRDAVNEFKRREIEEHTNKYPYYVPSRPYDGDDIPVSVSAKNGNIVHHFILTRFFCRKMGQDITDENLLQNGYNNMVRWFIPSLNNQTRKNFTLVVLRYDKANMKGVNGRLKNLKGMCDFDVEVIPYKQLDSFLLQNSVEGNMIISRCDPDDSVRNDIVEVIQEKMNRPGVGYMGFNLGYEQDIFNPYHLSSFRRHYGKLGTFSVMQSVKVDYNINRFHPFVWNHAMPEKFLAENNIKLDFTIMDEENRMFIRNLTKMNYTQTRSNSVKTSLREDVKMDRDEIFRLFGV